MQLPTHASDDAVHRQLRGPVVKPASRAALPLLLVEDEGRVLLFGHVDVVAGVCRRHDVPRAGVQQDALVILALDADQTHAVPVRRVTDLAVTCRWAQNMNGIAL